MFYLLFNRFRKHRNSNQEEELGMSGTGKNLLQVAQFFWFCFAIAGFIVSIKFTPYVGIPMIAFGLYKPLSLGSASRHAPHLPEIQTVPNPDGSQPTTIQNNKLASVLGGALIGTVTGIFAASTLIVFGILLSLTVVGAILGIPMIILGILMLFAGPFMGLFGLAAPSSLKGKCPHCATDVSATKGSLGFDCPACAKRIIVRNEQFFRLDMIEPNAGSHVAR